MNFTMERARVKTIYTALDDLCTLLMDVVEEGASVGFMPPVSREQARLWWRSMTEQLLTGQRHIFVAMQDGRTVGCVHLAQATAPNSLHRADIQKLLVHPSARRQGIARALMLAVEQHAAAIGLQLLVLDTERDSSAELVIRDWVGSRQASSHSLRNWAMAILTRCITTKKSMQADESKYNYRSMIK